MAVTSVIGEAGVRIRPITSGFSRELQALIDSANKQSQSGVLPLTLSSANAEQALSALVGRAERGAVLPIVALAKDAEDAVSGVKATAEQGAALPITPQASAAEEAVAELVGKAEEGASLPVTVSTAEAQSEIAATLALAERGATAPLQVSTELAEQEAAAFRGAFSAPLITPVALDLEDAIEQFTKLQDLVASTPLTPNIDLQGAASGIGQIGSLAGQSTGEVGQLSGLLGGLSDQITGLSGGLGGVTNRLSPLLSKGSLLVGGGLVGGALAFGSVISAGQQRLTTIEDSVAALEIQLGGAKQAASVVSDVLATVKGTPFNLDQFVSAARSLITFGVEAEKIPVYLNAIGEAAAGSGQGIEAVQRITDVFAQTTIAGRITLDDVYRLANVGVDALTILGNSFGKTTEEIKAMISAGAVPAEKALSAIVTGINEGSTGVAGSVNKLGGSMEKLRDTFSGAAGGLQAASARLGVAFLEPFRKVSVQVLQQFTEVLDAIGPALKSLLTNVATAGAGIVEAFSATLGRVPDFFKSLNQAFQSGGLEGLLNQIASFTGPLQSDFQSIFNNLREIAGQIGPIFQDLVAGAAQAAALLGGALVKALRVVVNAISELVNLLGALAETTPVIQALGAALGTLVGLSFLKKITGVSAAFATLNNVIGGATSATEASAAANDEDAAAKSKNAAATSALATAEGRLAAAQQARQISGGGAGGGAPKPVQFSANPFLTEAENAEAFQRALQGSEETAERTGSKLRRGIQSAGDALKGFAATFAVEIALVAAAAGFALGKQIGDSIVEGARAAGVAQGESILADISPKLKLTTDRTELDDALGFQEEQARIQGELDRRRSELEPGLNTYANSLDEIVAKADALSGKLLPDFLTPSIVQDSIDSQTARVEAYEQANAANETLIAAEREQQAVIAGSTKNWNLLAGAVKSSEGALSQLGAVKITDPSQQAANYERILATLVSAKSAQLELAGAAPDAIVGALPGLQKEAQALAQYDLPSLEAALNAAGISLSEVAEGDAAALQKALNEAAIASERGRVTATGLGDGLAQVAEKYAAAKKEAETFSNALFVQQAAWAQALSSADAFNTQLEDLQYRTDFTASQLSSLISGAQAAASATYERVRAEAELAGSTDAVGEATRAAVDQTESLRASFITTATAAGFTTEEANTLANAVFGLPGYVQIDIAIKANTQELDAARAKLNELIASGDAYIEGTNYLSGRGRDAQGAVNREEREQRELEFYRKLGQAEQDRARKESEALIATNKQKQEADKARADAKRQQDEAKRAAEKAAADAKRAAEEEQRRKEQELREFLQAIQNLERATGQFQGSIENVSKSLQQARDEFIGNLQQRVELSQASSVTRLIRNASERNRLLAEVQGGVTELQGRGLSADALRYLGVTGRAEDARAVRRLLRASPEQLAQLSGSIGTLSDTAQRAAYREQGQIIGKEVRTAIEQWAATPGAQQKLSFEQVLQIVAESRGDPASIARTVTERIGGTVKR
jgi:tape measure domain-containing protein